MEKKGIRLLENLHIPLWLLKDTCWLLEWRIPGVIMILPTITVAIIIAARTFKENQFFLNLAVCCWIMANSYWMCCEFYNAVPYKNYAAIPFVIGMISVSIYYLKKEKAVQE